MSPARFLVWCLLAGPAVIGIYAFCAWVRWWLWKDFYGLVGKSGHAQSAGNAGKRPATHTSGSGFPALWLYCHAATCSTTGVCPCQNAIERTRKRYPAEVTDMGEQLFINGDLYSATLVGENLWMVKRANRDGTEGYVESLIAVKTKDSYEAVKSAIERGSWA